MSLRVYESFVSEFMKIAAKELLDAGVRALNADRRGEEYAAGGQIPSNAPGETNLKPKFAMAMPAPVTNYHIYMGGGSKPEPGRMAAPLVAPDKYTQGKDIAFTPVKGALMGAGISGAVRSLQGKPLAGVPGSMLGPSTRDYRIGMGLGAAAGVGDVLIRRHMQKKRDAEALRKQANLNSATFTPARELSRGQEQGHFDTTQIHQGSTKRAPGIGHAFRLPKVGA